MHFIDLKISLKYSASNEKIISDKFESEVKRKTLVLITQHNTIYMYILQTGDNTNIV